MPYTNTRSLLSAIMLTCIVALNSSAETVAYYRFENGVPGQSFGNSKNYAIQDSSGYNHNLSPWLNPTASRAVPESTIPRTSEINTFSVHFTGAEDLYHIANDKFSQIVFTDFTIEAWVNFESLADWQTIIGRDDYSGPNGEGQGAQSLFYLSKSTDIESAAGLLPTNSLRVELITRDNRILAFNSSFKVSPNVWYHVAVVGNATTGKLTLYVDGSEVGFATGYNGLFAHSKNPPWTLGRGQYKGKSTDNFRGYLDEVRFSDTALLPGLFLNAMAPPPRPVAAVAVRP